MMLPDSLKNCQLFLNVNGAGVEKEVTWS